MKKTLAIISILTLVISCNQTKTPSEVTDAFDDMFPEAQSASWNQENDDEWEVKFILNSNEISACFDSKGIWLETEVEIEWEELPETVLNTINSNYGEYNIDEIKSIKSPDFAGYEIEMLKEEKDKKIDVYIDNEGVIAKIEQEEDNKQGI